MTKAQKIAELIATRVLADGHAAGAPKHVGSPSDGVSFAAHNGLEREYQEAEPYTELDVVSVVYRDGTPGEGDDEETEDEVLIYAAGKLTHAFLDTLPEVIDGVKITVEGSTLVHVNPETAQKYAAESLLFQRNGRIMCGSSCATATGFPGTLGALVTREGEDGLFILSCSHVLAACDYIRRGMPILSPAPEDAKPDGPVPLSIARLTKSIPMQHGHYSHENLCEIDAAVGKLINPDYVSSWQGDETGYDTPSRGASVTFVGR